MAARWSTYDGPCGYFEGLTRSWDSGCRRGHHRTGGYTVTTVDQQAVADDETGDDRLRVAIVEDHPLYREALSQVFESDAQFDLQLSVSTIEEFSARAPQPLPHVVIVDLHLPGLSGPEGVRRLVNEGFPVLVLSASTNGADVVRCIGEGARGYLSKDAQASEIMAACGAIAAGRNYISPTLAGHLLNTARQRKPAMPDLSAREREVLRHLALGKTDHAIAERLCISVSTVRSHLDRIRDKTGKRRRADLTRFALENAVGDSADVDTPIGLAR
ncbi:MAG: response regulator [Phycicoccus sp.]